MMNEDEAAEAEALERWLDTIEPEPKDARDGIWLRNISRAAERASRTHDELLVAVAEARANGESWFLIGAMLGISRQAAEQRFGA